MAEALILETTTPTGSICLIEPGGRSLEREFRSDRRHNSALFTPLQEILEGVEELNLVLVGSGPGSYSGTRVGIAAAQGVAIAMDCPAVAMPSVLAIDSVAKEEPTLMLGDARRGTFWSSRLEGGGMTEPLLQEAGDWEKTVLAAKEEGLDLVSFESSERWSLPEDVEVRTVVPNARLLWEAWNRAEEKQREKWRSEVPQPMYLKPPHITKAKRKVLG